MADEPSPRQVLYAVVAAALHAVVAVLAVASAGLAPTWWTGAVAAVWIAVGVVGAWRWRRTGLVLGLAIGMLVAWTGGAAVVLG